MTISPYINRFIQPDSIIPGAANPQSWNRYSYVKNSPVRYVDPSGHKECELEPDGNCMDSKKLNLWNFATDTLIELGGKDDLEAMASIVDKAAKIYGTYEKMIPALTEVFNGRDESNPLTIVSLGLNHENGCDGVGREAGKDCIHNTPEESFWDTGFHRDFQDGHNQIYHYWAYLSTGTSTGFPMGGHAFGYFIGEVGNLGHEIIGIGDAQGASWEDFALTNRALNTGTMIALGMIPPRELGNYIRNDLSTGTHYVNWLNQHFPLTGTR